MRHIILFVTFCIFCNQSLITVSSDNILYHHNTERLTTITKMNKVDREPIRSSLRDGLSPSCSGFLHLVLTALNLSILRQKALIMVQELRLIMISMNMVDSIIIIPIYKAVCVFVCEYWCHPVSHKEVSHTTPC